MAWKHLLWARALTLPFTSAERAVLKCLAEHADGDCGLVFLKTCTIVRECSLNRRTVQRAMHKLKAWRLIREAGWRGRAKQYWLNDMPGADACDTLPPPGRRHVTLGAASCRGRGGVMSPTDESPRETTVNPHGNGGAAQPSPEGDTVTESFFPSEDDWAESSGTDADGADADGAAEEEGASRRRDPDNPPGNVSPPEWRSACQAAEVIEMPGLPGPVVEPGSKRRALALVYFAELWCKRPFCRVPGNPWRDILPALTDAAHARREEDLLLLQALRRFPDGAYPNTRKEGRPSRLERLIRNYQTRQSKQPGAA